MSSRSDLRMALGRPSLLLYVQTASESKCEIWHQREKNQRTKLTTTLDLPDEHRSCSSLTGHTRERRNLNNGFRHALPIPAHAISDSGLQDVIDCASTRNSARKAHMSCYEESLFLLRHVPYPFEQFPLWFEAQKKSCFCYVVHKHLNVEWSGWFDPHFKL